MGCVIGSSSAFEQQLKMHCFFHPSSYQCLDAQPRLQVQKLSKISKEFLPSRTMLCHWNTDPSAAGWQCLSTGITLGKGCAGPQEQPTFIVVLVGTLRGLLY